MTQELLRRLTRSGTMYLIPADIHTKRIIRFTVTSQFTTADDILKDWGAISKMASNLLAEMQPLGDAEQPKEGEGEVIIAEDDQGTNAAEGNPDSGAGSEETESAASRLGKAEVELWIDKAWNRSRRPMRSLSCNSEPLPYTHFAPLCGYDFDTRPSPKDAAVASPAPSTTGSGPTCKTTEMPPNLLGKQVLKKLTKFNSVPSFYNQWVQCGHYQLCCPLKMPQMAQKRFASTCRTMSCMSSSPIPNTAPTPTPLDAANVHKLL